MGFEPTFTNFADWPVTVPGTTPFKLELPTGFEPAFF